MNMLFSRVTLDIMKKMCHQEHKSEFIDLFYNDPPFNSKCNYNVLFESAAIPMNLAVLSYKLTTK